MRRLSAFSVPNWAAPRGAALSSRPVRGTGRHRTATKRYKGEVEEIKRLLLSNGLAAYEADVEVEDSDGEFNVYVDAATGRIMLVNVEYWEIGRPAADDDD